MDTKVVEKLVTDVTICKKITVASTTYITPKGQGDTDPVCKVIEIKNRSGVGIYVKPNGSDEFPLADKEDRVVMVKKMSDIQLARQSGSGDITVHLIYEN